MKMVYAEVAENGVLWSLVLLQRLSGMSCIEGETVKSYQIQVIFERLELLV